MLYLKIYNQVVYYERESLQNYQAATCSTAAEREAVSKSCHLVRGSAQTLKPFEFVQIPLLPSARGVLPIPGPRC